MLSPNQHQYQSTNSTDPPPLCVDGGVTLMWSHNSIFYGSDILFCQHEILGKMNPLMVCGEANIEAVFVETWSKLLNMGSGLCVNDKRGRNHHSLINGMADCRINWKTTPPVEEAVSVGRQQIHLYFFILARTSVKYTRNMFTDTQKK